MASLSPFGSLWNGAKSNSHFRRRCFLDANERDFRWLFGGYKSWICTARSTYNPGVFFVTATHAAGVLTIALGTSTPKFRDWLSHTAGGVWISLLSDAHRTFATQTRLRSHYLQKSFLRSAGNHLCKKMLQSDSFIFQNKTHLAVSTCSTGSS